MPVLPDKKAPGVVVLTGNPNCGKTTVFNELTGLRAKVGNYAGVTVERKEGRLLGAPSDYPVTVLDLPGTYSLSPHSLDEKIARDVLLNRLSDVAEPSLIVVVVDAFNLERNLYYATQVIELGYPTLIALNMMDVAADNGHRVDAKQLARLLKVPVVPMVAHRGEGIAELRTEILKCLQGPGPSGIPVSFYDLPEAFIREIDLVAVELDKVSPGRTNQAHSEAMLLLSDERALESSGSHYPDTIRLAVEASRQHLEQAGIAWRTVVIERRYARVAAIHGAVSTQAADMGESYSDRVDKVMTHKVWGLLFFIVIMALMFQSIFTFAKLPMKALDSGIVQIGNFIGRLIPPGELHSLMEDGVIAGVGAVVVFLPQICLLFLFIGLLEDTGYMARAAFLMDRLMSKVGLHGKSFIPMLSSFACAIPGIMATRTIEGAKDRLVTILVAPLMACSARLPIYTLLIAACIPEGQRVLGIFKLQGIVLFGLYLLGIVVALIMAWFFKKTILKGEPPMLIMELPPYKRPAVKAIFRHVWDRSKLFLQKAGTVILGVNILLWFLATYPHSTGQERKYDALRAAVRTNSVAKAADAAMTKTEKSEKLDEKLAEIGRQEAAERLQHSFAGRLGQIIEPVIAPLGMDWKIGIGIISSFAAREVFVSTMSTVYSVDAKDRSKAATQSLAENLRTQTRPDGSQLYTPVTAITLMVFYVFALQCASTVAVVHRETNSWRWPIFQWAYMGLLAWGLAFLTFHGGHLLGWH